LFFPKLHHPISDALYQNSIYEGYIQHLVSKLPQPQLGDDNHANSSIHEDVVAFTSTFQLPRVPSLDQRAFEVVVPKVLNTPLETKAIEDAGHYHHLDDTIEEGIGPTIEVDIVDALVCKTSVQHFVEV